MTRVKIFGLLVCIIFLFTGCGENKNKYAMPSVPQEEVLIENGSILKPERIKFYHKGRVRTLSQEQTNDLWDTLNDILDSDYKRWGRNDVLDEESLAQLKEEDCCLELLYDKKQVWEWFYEENKYYTEYYGILFTLYEDILQYVMYRENYAYWGDEKRLSLSSHAFHTRSSGEGFAVNYAILLRNVMELL